jgi:hypothetical protein
MSRQILGSVVHGGALQRIKTPGKIPPANVTNAATASAANTAAGSRPGADPSGSVIYISTATRK